MIATNIFDFVLNEKTGYETSQGVPVADGFEWSMSEHITSCIRAKDGIISDKRKGQFDERPVKNIILPILNVHYRTEGFDVKDIEPYVDNADSYYKSLLVRKFHDRWARMEGIDTFIDEVVMSYVDFGGVLVKNVKGVRPEVIPLQKIAFCDQTDILSGPFAIKHQFSIDQLKERAGVWNKEVIDELCQDARSAKSVDQANGKDAKTPGRYIEVYEVHGAFPSSWTTQGTKDYSEADEDSYSYQVHIISFLNGAEASNQKGRTLFKGKEKKGNFKVLKRDARFGTALGRSAIEELFEPQVWTNYNMIQIKEMLDKAALMLGLTDDPSFASRNKITDMSQGEFMTKNPNTTVEPFVFPTANMNQFETMLTLWENHARLTGSASDPALGVDPVSGTPLGTTQLVTQQGQGIHEFRRGQIASFVEEIYRDWVIPHLADEINKGQTFMAELSLDEMQNVAEAVVTNHTNALVKGKVLMGSMIKPDEHKEMMNTARMQFMKGGNKIFAQLLKDEISEVPLDVKVNVAGKQKNMQQYVDKLSNIFRSIFSNPAILQDPNAVKLLNMILEPSGLSPLSFNFTTSQPQQMQMPQQNQQPAPSPLQVNEPVVK